MFDEGDSHRHSDTHFQFAIGEETSDFYLEL